jgi:hypothetical protein
MAAIDFGVLVIRDGELIVDNELGAGGDFVLPLDEHNAVRFYKQSIRKVIDGDAFVAEPLVDLWQMAEKRSYVAFVPELNARVKKFAGNSNVLATDFVHGGHRYHVLQGFDIGYPITRFWYKRTKKLVEKWIKKHRSVRGK